MRDMLYFSVFFCIVALAGAIALSGNKEVRCKSEVVAESSELPTGREALRIIGKILN